MTKEQLEAKVNELEGTIEDLKGQIKSRDESYAKLSEEHGKALDDIKAKDAQIQEQLERIDELTNVPESEPMTYPEIDLDDSEYVRRLMVAVDGEIAKELTTPERDKAFFEMKKACQRVMAYLV